MARAFGTYIQAALARRGWSATQYGAKVGKDSGYISKVINGRIRPPPKLLERLADALRLDGQEREEFMWLAALSSAPEVVEKRLVELENKVHRFEQLLHRPGAGPSGQSGSRRG